MKLIDLTHTFHDHMPVYPGDSVPLLTQTAFLEKDGYTDYHITTGMHVGTHMDAPLHFVLGGKKLSEISLDRFFGKGKLIDARGHVVVGGGLLEDADIEEGDIVLVLMGHGKKFGEPDYYPTYPEIGVDFAERLVEKRVKILGLDTPSPDRSPYNVHKLLLEKEVLIIENLNNLESLVGVGSFNVVALPPKFATEGAPVRVVAVIKD